MGDFSRMNSVAISALYYSFYRITMIKQYPWLIFIIVLFGSRITAVRLIIVSWLTFIQSSWKSRKVSVRNSLLTGEAARESGIESGVSGGDHMGVGNLGHEYYWFRNRIRNINPIRDRNWGKKHPGSPGITDFAIGSRSISDRNIRNVLTYRLLAFRVP